MSGSRGSLRPVTPDAFLAEWHRIVRERDVTALAGLLAPDVAIGAPPYWEPCGARRSCSTCSA